MLRYFFSVGSAIYMELGSLLIGFLNAADELMIGYYSGYFGRLSLGEVEGLVATALVEFV